jgi:ParB family chromosome partitioning protein
MQEENSKISIHEIPVENISPNPYQPRREFNELNLSSLAESIRQYGVMQPIVVTIKTDGNFELISGERRLRASKLAGKITIPAVVRSHEHSNEEKFELAIIENLQREDLNPIDKAKSFKKLVEEFNLTHSEIAQKMGKSREYISNSLRVLMLPDNILDSIVMEEISEGHSRPLLMLKDRPFEQGELFKKIIQNKLTVRAAEKIARSVAVEKVRKPDSELDSDLKRMEIKLAEKLGTKVSIDKKISGEGGKLTIEYFSKEDLEKIINLVKGNGLSSIPILELKKEEEKSSNFAIEKFENNFTAQKIGEESLESLSKQEPVIFEEEIKELNSDSGNKKKEDNVNKINIDKFMNEENKKEDGVDGFNITSFDRNVHVEDVISIKNNNVLDHETEAVEKNGITNLEHNLKTDKVEGNETKQLYGDAFSNFGEISNFNIPVKEENKVEPSIQVEDMSSRQTMEQVQKEGGNIFSERENNFREEVEEKEIRYTEKVNSDTTTVNHEVNQKSETQKRIDAILTGNSTVSKEYGIEENSTEKNHEEHFNLEENIKEKEDGRIEESSIYKQFLESKKRVQEEKESMYEGTPSQKTKDQVQTDILNKPKEENLRGSFGDKEAASNSFGKLSENSSDFISGGSGIDNEKKPEMTEESSIAMNQINDSMKRKEQIDAIFSGDDFIPKKENFDKEGNKEENPGKDNFGFSI